jgi:hypothetical protein
VTGLRWLVVHRAVLGPAERDAWERVPASLASRVTLGDDTVFEVTMPPRTDLVRCCATSARASGRSAGCRARRSMRRRSAVPSATSR